MGSIRGAHTRKELRLRLAASPAVISALRTNPPALVRQRRGKDIAELLAEDPVVKRAITTILKVAEKYGVEVLSVVIYGSRAKGDFSFTSDYDCFTLLSDRTTLLQYTQLHSQLRMLTYQIGNIKIYSNTLGNFKKILEDNPFLGAFCYIIATDGVPVYDPKGEFERIQEEVKALPPEEKAKYIRRCIAMSAELRSPKWVDYWKRELEKLRQTANREQAT